MAKNDKVNVVVEAVAQETVAQETVVVEAVAQETVARTHVNFGFVLGRAILNAKTESDKEAVLANIAMLMDNMITINGSCDDSKIADFATALNCNVGDVLAKLQTLQSGGMLEAVLGFIPNLSLADALPILAKGDSLNAIGGQIDAYATKYVRDNESLNYTLQLQDGDIVEVSKRVSRSGAKGESKHEKIGPLMPSPFTCLAIRADGETIWKHGQKIEVVGSLYAREGFDVSKTDVSSGSTAALVCGLHYANHVHAPKAATMPNYSAAWWVSKDADGQSVFDPIKVYKGVKYELVMQK